MAEQNIEISESMILNADGSSRHCETEVLKEHTLTIIINEQPALKLVCTNEYLPELVTGRLFTDGFIERAEDIERLIFCRYEREASVFLTDDINLEERLKEEKSCCTGNRNYLMRKDKAALKKLPETAWEAKQIFSMAECFAQGQPLHSRTQGTHSCILARGDEIVFSCEDIGRHNAIDKAAGYALRNKLLRSACMLYTSGRVPVDMAEKVIAAGIPVLASKSVPTAEALALAKEYGLTIIARAHTDSMQLFDTGK